jgi:hypothetical protein
MNSDLEAVPQTDSEDSEEPDHKPNSNTNTVPLILNYDSTVGLKQQKLNYTELK